MLLKKRATSHEAAGKDDWKKKKSTVKAKSLQSTRNNNGVFRD